MSAVAWRNDLFYVTNSTEIHLQPDRMNLIRKDTSDEVKGQNHAPTHNTAPTSLKGCFRAVLTLPFDDETGIVIHQAT